MIPLVSSPAVALSGQGKATIAAGSEGAANKFIQLLQMVAGSPSYAGEPLGAGLAPAAIAAAYKALTKIGGPDGSEPSSNDLYHIASGANTSEKPGQKGPYAVEMLLALLGAAASRLQPWQVTPNDDGQPDDGQIDQKAGSDDSATRDLAEQLFALLTPESLALFMQSLTTAEGQPQPGAADGGSAIEPGMRAAMLLARAVGLELGSGLVPAAFLKPGPDQADSAGDDAKGGVDSENLMTDATMLGKSAAGVTVDGNRLHIAEIGQDSLSEGATASGQELKQFGIMPGPNVIQQIIQKEAIQDRDLISVQEALHRLLGKGEGLSTRAWSTADGSPSYAAPQVSFDGGAPVPEAAISGLAQAGSASVDSIVQATTVGGQAAPAMSVAIADQIARHGRLLVQRGNTGFSIQLEPKELGRVKVHVSTGSEGLTVKLVAESSDLRQIIQTSLPHLKTALEGQGLLVDIIDVGVDLGSSSFNSAQGGAPGRENIDNPQLLSARPWGDGDDVGKSEIPRSATGNSLVDYRI